MPRKKNVNPTYLLHTSGQARVRIDGKDHLLGLYGSDDSRRRYGELVARLASGQTPVDPFRGTLPRNGTEADPGPTVNEIALSFMRHAELHYIKNGKPTSEIPCYRSCLRILCELYGTIPAKDFGPLSLKAVRVKMVDIGWARSNINTQIGRIRRVFKRAIENEMIDVAVLTRLQSLAPLLAGRTEAPDNAPRHAVDHDNIEAVRQRVGPLVRDLIDLQLATGARSGELLQLTTATIVKSGEVWQTTLTDHKCQHHGQRRTLFFGPQAKLILTKYLSADPAKPLFDMGRTAYCRAVTRACEKAGVKRWTPHWLRHTFVTRIRESHGIEAAQSLAGHSAIEMTEHYSQRLDKLAAQTAAACG